MTTETKVQHTPEPWRLEEDSYSSGFRGANDFYVGGIIWDEHSELVAETDKANARRIVAAVNACKGIPVEALEGGVIEELIHWVEYLAQGDWEGVAGPLATLAKLEGR